MHKIGGRKKVNSHYKLSYNGHHDFEEGIVAGLEINVWLLLRRAGTPVLLTEWEAEGFSPC